MIAAVINGVLVLVGSIVGLLVKGKLSEKFSRAVMVAVALCVAMIGISSAMKDENTLCVIICMVVGVILGEWIKIEQRIDALGEKIKSKVTKGGAASAHFTEGFMTATLLFCIGSMAIVGSIEAGINKDYTIILSKSIIDCISAVTLAAALGIGVVFSSIGVLVYQGIITLIAIYVGPFLSQAMINEMSAVGGLLIIGLAINMLGLAKDKLRVGNMLPAVFLPVVYIPVENLIKSLF